MSIASVSQPSRQSARRLMMAIGFLAALPILIFTVFAGRSLVNQQQAALSVELQQQADFGARELAREVRVVFATLDALATSDAAMRGDYAALHAHATRVVALSPRIGGISAVDADGVARLSTVVPFTVRMPVIAATDTDKKVLETGVRQLSPLHVAPLSGKKQVLFMVPVKQDGKIVMILRASMWTEAIGEVVYEQPVPATWNAAVVDQNMIQIARSRESARFVGQPATELTQVAIRAGKTTPYSAVTSDGDAMVASVARVAGTPWNVAIAAPKTWLDAEFWHAFLPTLWIGAFCVLLSALGTVWLARSLRRQIETLTATAAAQQAADADAKAKRAEIRF